MKLEHKSISRSVNKLEKYYWTGDRKARNQANVVASETG
jgi:hypothetical protein